MSEPTPEPTLSDVLAAIQALAVKVDGVDAKADGLAEKLDANQLATGARFDLVDSRQADAAAVLETLSGMAYDHQQALASAEARLTSRVSDVQQVVQALKADLAAHTSDPQVHDHRGTPGGAA